MSVEETYSAIERAQQQYKAIAPVVGDKQRYALAFWRRVLNNSSAVAALAHTGFGAQSVAMHRLTIEHFAYMYALLNGTLTSEQAEKQNKYDLAQCAKALVLTGEVDKRAGRQVVEPELASALQDFASTEKMKNAETGGISIYNLLDQLDLKFYHDQYRLHSLHAAHANILSAIWEPSAEDTDHLLADVRSILQISGLAWEAEAAKPA